MAMKNPPHPGESIRDWLNGLTVAEAAGELGLAQQALSRVLDGKAGISPAMALKLEAAGWSNAAFWMRRQASYDLAQERLNEYRQRTAA